ncbi:MAG: hypothetical protein LBJ72_13405 [Dysgonamonadaceae bacterium]|jgi:hypothetical protein|nr:hypothetical protein [Dysgonamonadaceae bacterium]
MKKISFIYATIFVLLGMTSCEKDNIWGDGLAEMEHVYYIGFYKTNVNTDALNYEIAADGAARWRIGTGTWNNTGEVNITSPIPFQLSSERIRSYDAVTYFWVTNNGTTTLTPGTDYIVVNESGSEIASGSGAYSLTWPETRKGIQNVKIKRLTSAKGSLRVNVLNPANGTPNASDLSTTVNNKADQYEIRGLTFDYNKVTVTFN